jgi:methyltransferase-like protein 6
MYIQARIKTQGANVTTFWRDKYVREASKYWHTFYKRNTDNFYKDRHYLHIVFPELLNQPVIGENSDGRLRLLEVGCGICIEIHKYT